MKEENMFIMCAAAVIVSLIITIGIYHHNKNKLIADTIRNSNTNPIEVAIAFGAVIDTGDIGAILINKKENK